MTDHVEFRDFQPSDVTRIDFGEPGSLEDLGGPPDDAAAEPGIPDPIIIVATWRGDIVGYISSWLAQVHRTRRFFDVQVAPRSQGRRIATRLVAQLKARSDRPLAARAVEGSDSAGFLRGLGARPYAWCPPMELPRRQFGRAIEILGGHRDVIPASSLSPGEPEHLWMQFYRWTHQDWSPVYDSDQAREALRAEAGELDLDRTAIALVDGQPGAAAFVFDDPGAPTVCAETLAPEVPDGDDALARAVCQVVRDARDNGVRKLAFDGREQDPHFGPLAQRLPFEGSRMLLLEL
ncbi:GNAT family N-acetyltransferase [Acidipropionibacterium thoenii]|uniref:GNAT family N-acetyltransferase n=1 Tax=Acidipropionibacterium thoenii TaxID=1751 RepID=UPI00042A35BC|nr:GNAT family N-acetyltransferase [Acidipropionibacterium thoenii]